jgi:aspartate/methionine/tyrosine aminotransferase
MVLNSPNNPTGAVWSGECLEAISRIVAGSRAFVVSDEVYHAFLFGEAEHLTPAALPGMRERTVIVDSVSKTFSMTGWRVGWVAGPEPVVSAILRIRQHSTICATAFAQYGAVAALEGPGDVVREMVVEFERRRDEAMATACLLRHLRCSRPQGTFYIFPRIVGVDMPDEEVALRILDRTGVSTVGGSAFGRGGAGHLRISLVRPAGELRDALEAADSAIASI